MHQLRKTVCQFMTQIVRNFWRVGVVVYILGDPGADKGGEGKSKRAEKYIWNEEK